MQFEDKIATKINETNQKFPNLFRNLFLSSSSIRIGRWVLISLLIQQIIAASSSFWITEVARHIQLGGGWRQYLIGFLFSMVLPYIPGAVALHFLNLWIFNIQRLSSEFYVEALRGRVDLFNDSKFRDLHLSQMSKELPQFINDFLIFIFQYLSHSLNLILQLVAIALILGSNYLFALATGVFLVFLFLRKSKNTNEVLSHLKQKSFSQISAHLAGCWGTVTIDNRTNFHYWKSTLEKLYNQSSHHNSDFSLHKEVGGALLSLIGALPFLIYVIYRFLWLTPDINELVSLSVLLPRIFQIFNIGTSVCIQTKTIGSFKGRWRDISEKFLQIETAGTPTKDRILSDRILVRNQSTAETHSVERFIDILGNSNSGLFTITGPNGAGKSSLLLELKTQLGESAYYLPANGDIQFETLEGKVLSTGQKMCQALKEILTLTSDQKPKYLLLDEWDANIDAMARQELSHELLRQSQNYTIIEVRHSS